MNFVTCKLYLNKTVILGGVENYQPDHSITVSYLNSAEPSAC